MNFKMPTGKKKIQVTIALVEIEELILYLPRKVDKVEHLSTVRFKCCHHKGSHIYGIVTITQNAFLNF